MPIRFIMSKEKNPINDETRATKVSRQIYCVLLFGIMTGLIPGISEKRVFSQSTYVENKPTEQYSPSSRKHTITSTSSYDAEIPFKDVNRAGSTSSGRNGVSLKSTDAAIDPIYQQPPVCMNCGIADFMIPGDAAAIISGGIISGIIGSTIFRKGAHRYHPADATMSQDIYPSTRHFNRGSENHIINRRIGINAEDYTRSVIQLPVAPYYYSGDREQWIDGELKFNNNLAD